MFNFSVNKGRVKVTDIVWMTKAAKWNGIVQGWRKDQPAIICWFADTLQHLQSLFNAETGDVSLFSASHIHPSQLEGKTILFAEHYPLPQKETALFQRLPVKEIIVHSSLEEPFFRHFGGDKIIQLMKQMGMAADESICHPLISKAIITAQEKLEKKVLHESLAASPSEWMEKNILY